MSKHKRNRTYSVRVPGQSAWAEGLTAAGAAREQKHANRIQPGHCIVEEGPRSLDDLALIDPLRSDFGTERQLELMQLADERAAHDDLARFALELAAELRRMRRS